MTRVCYAAHMRRLRRSLDVRTFAALLTTVSYAAKAAAHFVMRLLVHAALALLAVLA